jgi:FtsZ-binding cell division protein ZapB
LSSTVLLRLNEKIQQAASVIDTLKKERERLLAEVTLMQEENRRSRKLLREHQQLLSERERLRSRLEKLLKKLDSLKV